jgi:ABC-2 type transport system ATP-binding protein
VFADPKAFGNPTDLQHRTDAFARSGRSVLLTTHYLEEADALADRIVVIDRGRVVADGTPSAIKAQSATKVIRCTTSLTLGELEAIDGVHSVRTTNGRAELLVSVAEPVVREHLARDKSLSDLEVVGAGLEEAFLAITRPSDSSRAARLHAREPAAV